MKGFFRLLPLSLIFASAAFVSCNEDDPDTGWIQFDKSAKFLGYGQTWTATFSSANIRSYSLDETPTGWADPVVDYGAKTVTITAPVQDDEDASESGSIVISGVTHDGKTVKGTLFVSTSEQVDLSDKRANSYLLNKGGMNYLIDVSHKGNSTTTLQPVRIAVLWQTSKELIQYLELVDGKASFYIGTDPKKENIQRGNAVIGAYNSDQKLIWSWHIWAADYDPQTTGRTVNFNGYTLMDRNLGALESSNETLDLILASYGLYYQWGRKDPFVGPAAYNSVGTAAMYNQSGSKVSMTHQQTDSERGTMTYSIENPWTFVAGVEASSYDWLWPGNQSPRWDETKTVNDPCPYGWRVAPAAAFQNLSIKDPFVGEKLDSTYTKRFSWTLTDGADESLFIGAGRRIYTNSSIQNIYINTDDPSDVRTSAIHNQPWVGLYWTTDPAADNRATAFYFWFDKADLTKSGVEHARSYERANGMQVRCVKEE